jgi:hypothetical protein
MVKARAFPGTSGMGFREKRACWKNSSVSACSLRFGAKNPDLKLLESVYALVNVPESTFSTGSRVLGSPKSGSCIAPVEYHLIDQDLFTASDLYAPPQHVVSSYATGRSLEGILATLRGPFMQDRASELRQHLAKEVGELLRLVRGVIIAGGDVELAVLAEI